MTYETNSEIEILETLGVGGMASVYLARKDGRDVAVKKMHAFLASDPMSVAAFADETHLGSCIAHPNVVGVLEFIEGSGDADPPALVMEWVEGTDLGKLVRAVNASGRLLPLDVVAAIICDVLSGLHAAHESRRADGLALDIVHRDVSPQNILIGFDGVMRVTDFGVAKAAVRTQFSEHGAIKGKLGYLAPEQLDGRCDRRSDIFGVGAVLWELLTGERMRSSVGLEVLVEILCKRPGAPSVYNRAAACLDDVAHRALASSPEDRFATAAEMCAAIANVVTPASPERVSTVTRAFLALAEESSAADELARSGERARADVGVAVAADEEPTRRIAVGEVVPFQRRSA